MSREREFIEANEVQREEPRKPKRDKPTAEEVFNRLEKERYAYLSDEDRLAIVAYHEENGFKGEGASIEKWVEPKWSVPITWQYLAGTDLCRGDGILINNEIFIVLKRLRFRRKTANILCQAHHNPAKYRRAGDVDFVYGFKNYVGHQQLSKMGVEL